MTAVFCSARLAAIFIGTILLPIVGNAAEHASALTVAYKGKINLAIGVAVGSSIQIALFVIPFMTLIAAASGQAMSLDFHLLEVASIFLSVALVGFMLSDGKATWLKGALLVFMYLIIAAAFYYHVDD
jgi:Ca2+:H+ antiporter